MSACYQYIQCSRTATNGFLTSPRNFFTNRLGLRWGSKNFAISYDPTLLSPFVICSQIAFVCWQDGHKEMTPSVSSLSHMYFNHTTEIFYKHLQCYNSPINSLLNY